jgi:beta-glucosidase/6-phospho-beta-glucosidase/beta-galactosidase
VSERPKVMATLDGYAVEGGFDRTGEPATCFSPTVSLGRHAGPGGARDLWTDYESVLDLAATLGLDGVRLTIEWTRLEPRRGLVDDHALAHYQEVVTHARSVGLRVTAALVDAAWPAWLGLEAWLLPWVEPYAVAYARRVVGALGDVLDGVVVFADPAGIVARGFLEGAAPPWRRGAIADAASAAEQVSRIEATLRADDLVGPLVVGRTRTVSLDRPVDELVAALTGRDVAEVYLRSLVSGTGPTAAPVGLLSLDGDAWRVDVSDQLRAVWA